MKLKKTMASLALLGVVAGYNSQILGETFRLYNSSTHTVTYCDMTGSTRHDYASIGAHARSKPLLIPKSNGKIYICFHENYDCSHYQAGIDNMSCQKIENFNFNDCLLENSDCEIKINDDYTTEIVSHAFIKRKTITQQELERTQRRMRPADEEKHE